MSDSLTRFEGCLQNIQLSNCHRTHSLLHQSSHLQQPLSFYKRATNLLVYWPSHSCASYLARPKSWKNVASKLWLEAENSINESSIDNRRSDDSVGSASYCFALHPLRTLRSRASDSAVSNLCGGLQADQTVPWNSHQPTIHGFLEGKEWRSGDET